MFLSCTTILDFCSIKYLGGHSDVLGGVLTARSMDLWTKLNKMRMAVGNTMVISLHYGTKFQTIIFFPSKTLSSLVFWNSQQALLYNSILQHGFEFNCTVGNIYFNAFIFSVHFRCQIDQLKIIHKSNIT